jgi:hypothetical protein
MSDIELDLTANFPPTDEGVTGFLFALAVKLSESDIEISTVISSFFATSTSLLANTIPLEHADDAIKKVSETLIKDFALKIAPRKSGKRTTPPVSTEVH